MAELKKKKRCSHSWWFDSHNKMNPNRSPWLQSTLSDLDVKTKAMLHLIEEDGDSFALRAEMYYKKRPELISIVEEFYRDHRSLAEKYDHIKSESGGRLQSPWPSHSSPLPSAKYSPEKSLSPCEKAYDSYSEAYGPEESDESEFEDTEKEETVQDNLESDTEQVSNAAASEELTRLRKEVEKLREENSIQHDELMQKDEEKREVIRQLSSALDLLREENSKLKKRVAAKTNPKMESSHIEFNKAKENFLGRLFCGFTKPQPQSIALRCL